MLSSARSGRVAAHRACLAVRAFGGLGKRTRAEQDQPDRRDRRAQPGDDRGLVPDLVRSGMSIARVNCSHDTPVEWTKMVAKVRQAQRASGGT